MTGNSYNCIKSSSYYETNKEEFTLLNSQRIQIEQYLHNFFLQHNLLLQRVVFQLNDKSLHLILHYFFLSYDNTPLKKRTFKASYRLKKVQRRRPSFKQTQKQKKESLEKSFDLYQLLIWAKVKKPRKVLIKFKKIRIVTLYKRFFNRIRYKTLGVLKSHFFHEHLLETISLFTKRKFHISLVFKNINRGINVIFDDSERSFLKKQSLLLKRYSKKDFFKDCLNIFVIAAKISNSSKLFSYIISEHLRHLRYHKPFLAFVSRLLKILIFPKKFLLKGIKLIINGRLNNKSRSSSFLVRLGSIPTVTKSSELIDYSESTCYTKNGTFGVKVWCNHF